MNIGLSCGTVICRFCPRQGQLDFAEITLFAARELEDDPLRCDTALNLLAAQDLIFYTVQVKVSGIVSKSNSKRLQKVPIVCLGHDPSFWTLRLSLRDRSTVHSYMV